MNVQSIRDRIAALTLYFMRGQCALGGGSFDEFVERKASFTPPEGCRSLSKVEADFIEDPEPDERSLLNSSWAVEATLPLLWAVRLIPDLNWPEGPCDLDEVIPLLKLAISPEYSRRAQLRDLEEVKDQADLYYRLMWAAREAVLGRRPLPPGMEPSVIYERRRSLTWLVDADDWDHVDLST